MYTLCCIIKQAFICASLSKHAILFWQTKRLRNKKTGDKKNLLLRTHEVTSTWRPSSFFIINQHPKFFTIKFLLHNRPAKEVCLIHEHASGSAGAHGVFSWKFCKKKIMLMATPMLHWRHARTQWLSNDTKHIHDPLNHAWFYTQSAKADSSISHNSAGNGSILEYPFKRLCRWRPPVHPQ